MKRLMVFLIILVFILPAFGQSRDSGIFSSAGQLDTLGTSDDSLSTQVYWRNWDKMNGSFKIYGKMWLLSGSSVNITVKIQPVNKFSAADTLLGNNYTLGTVTVADSAVFEYSVSGQPWWNLQQGYNAHFVPSATGSQVKILGRELCK